MATGCHMWDKAGSMAKGALYVKQLEVWQRMAGGKQLRHVAEWAVFCIFIALFSCCSTVWRVASHICCGCCRSGWLTGECHDKGCPQPHPPFSLDEDPIPPHLVPSSIVKLWPGAPIYRPPSPAGAAAGAAGPDGRHQASSAAANPQPAAREVPGWIEAAPPEHRRSEGKAAGAMRDASSKQQEEEPQEEKEGHPQAVQESEDSSDDELSSMLQVCGCPGMGSSCCCLLLAPVDPHILPGLAPCLLANLHTGRRALVIDSTRRVFQFCPRPL